MGHEDYRRGTGHDDHHSQEVGRDGGHRESESDGNSLVGVLPASTKRSAHSLVQQSTFQSTHICRANDTSTLEFTTIQLVHSCLQIGGSLELHEATASLASDEIYG
jgi:hypothetical protein